MAVSSLKPPGRREVLFAGLAALSACATRTSTPPQLRVTGFDLVPVRATERTVWLFVRVTTDDGLTGLGEASDAYGFANTTKANADDMRAELERAFAHIRGRSPLDVAAYRAAGRERARTQGLVAATAFSAIEQALWDLAGQALGVPIHVLFGGAVREALPVYANINRATKPRTPEGFADTARRAYADGFRAMKAAPFDGFPPPGWAAAVIGAAVDQGIAALEAMRAAVPDAELMVDCHSFFDVALAKAVAKRLEPVKLTWYEEPVPPERVEETLAIHRGIQQPMAGGEILFGVEGFTPLLRTRAIDVIMPDVKHCGGLAELSHIAAAAQAEEIAVAPHNPSGPVSTLASAHIGATLENLRFLELQWGETEWRGEMLDPPEVFANGTLTVPARPGLGAKLNQKLVERYKL